MIYLIGIAIVICNFPRLLVWAMVAVIAWNFVGGFYHGLSQPGKRKKKPTHYETRGPGIDNWG